MDSSPNIQKGHRRNRSQGQHTVWVPKQSGSEKSPVGSPPQHSPDPKKHSRENSRSQDVVISDITKPITVSIPVPTDSVGMNNDDDDLNTDTNKQREYEYGNTIKFEEDSEHEFKAIQISKRPLDLIAEHCEKYINAFLNTDGGTIYFGVEDDGTIVGIPMNRHFRDSIRLRIDDIVNYFKPQVDPHLCKVVFAKVKMTGKLKTIHKEQKIRMKINRNLLSSSKFSKNNDFDDLYDEEENEDDEEEEKIEISNDPRFVLEVTVSKGRAPIYFTRHGTVWIRRSGSCHAMDKSTIDSRMKKGRPLADKFSSVPKDFIGREEEIENIRDFIESNNRTNCLTVLLYGLPVVGKSTLARRLVEEFSSLYPDGFHYIDLKGTTEHYIKITDARIRVIRTVYPSMTLPEDKNEIHGLYDSCFNNKRTILLIENAGRPEQIKKLEPESAKRCLIIVTSRKDLNLDVTMESISIRLGALKPEQAVKLLRSIVPTVGNKQAQEIAKLCGYLPLPIRIIGSSLNPRKSLPNRADPDQLIEQLKNNDQRLSILDTAFGTYDSELTHYLYPITLFRASFDVNAAASLFDEPYEKAVDSLGILLAHSLIEFDSKTLRYFQNDLIKLHASNTAIKESSPDQMNIWRTRFIKHYINFISETTKESPEQKNQIYMFEAANLEACVAYSVSIDDNELAKEVKNVVAEFLSGLERRRFEAHSNAILLRGSGELDRIDVCATQSLDCN